MSNNVSFTGGFFIVNPGKVKWKHIQECLPKKKCVFQQFNNSGDKFVALKNHYDKDMLDMLLKKKVDFKFYPEINLKTRLDSENIEEATSIIAAQSNVVEGRKNLLKYVKSLVKPVRFAQKKYKWKPNDHVEQTFKALGLDASKYRTEIKDGITRIYAKNGKKIAISSPNSANGYNYVYVLPKSKTDLPKRYAIDETGEIVHTFSILNIDNFNKLFKSAVKINKGRVSGE